MGDGQMKRARFAEEQVIAVRKELEAEANETDLAGKYWIAAAAPCNGKAKYAG